MRTIRRLVNLAGRARRTVNLIGWLSSVLPLLSTVLVGVRTFLMERSRVLADAPEMIDTVNVGTVMSLIPVWVWVLAGVFSGLGVLLVVVGFMSHTGKNKSKSGEGEATTSATVDNSSTGDNPTPPLLDDDGDDDYGLGEV